MPVDAHPDGIVLLHGIFRSHRSMAKLEAHLRKAGYRTLNLGYPSTRLPLEAIAEHLHQQIDAFAASLSGQLHFVGYSMGGLVIRTYLHRFMPARMGRVVMLATPNQGSEVADFLKPYRLYRRFYGPAGQQLVTGLENRRALFGDVRYELGIIAGNRPIDFVSSRLIGAPNDGKVSVASTKIEGMSDHVVIAANHTFFPINRHAWKHTLQFIRHGAFSTPSDEVNHA